jgi:hypothetical protein
VPPWLEGIIRKLHQKDVLERFQSAAEVAELLEGCLAHVQQPSQHLLPVVAEKLGRQVSAAEKAVRAGGSAVLRMLMRWQWAAAAALIGGLSAALLFVVLREPNNSRIETTESAGNASVSATTPELDRLMLFDEEFREGRDQLQEKLDEMRQSLWPAPGVWIAPERDVSELRQRAQMLEHGFKASPPLAPDPVEVELEHIRQRLKVLRQQADGVIR